MIKVRANINDNFWSKYADLVRNEVIPNGMH